MRLLRWGLGATLIDTPASILPPMRLQCRLVGLRFSSSATRVLQPNYLKRTGAFQFQLSLAIYCHLDYHYLGTLRINTVHLGGKSDGVRGR
jgi:hypothetical protein